MRPNEPSEAICLWTPAQAAIMTPMAPLSTCEALTTVPLQARFSWDAVPFIASKSGVPHRDFGFHYREGFCQVSLQQSNAKSLHGQLRSRSGQSVGLRRRHRSDSAMRFGRREARSAPPLVQGVKYWVVATTNDQQAGLDATWYASNDAEFGLSPGYEWLQFGGVTPGFLVQ